MPEGCLLLQSGIMFEHLTGGYIEAGFHEVVYDSNVKAKVAANIAENEASQSKKHSLWRISSTLFGHLRYDVDLTPMPELSHLHNKVNIDAGKYKPGLTAHDKLMEELEAISLA